MTMPTSVYVKYEPNRAKWRVYMLWKKKRITAFSDITLFRDQHTSFKLSLWVKFELYWTKGREEMLVTRIYFFVSFCYDLNLRPKTWFKITAHSSLKSTLWVKYQSDLASGREVMLRTIDLRRVDGLITIAHQQSRVLIIQNLF